LAKLQEKEQIMPTQDTPVNRRQFLKRSVIAGAAVTAGGMIPATASAEGAPSKWNKEVDIVIVGTGHAGLASAIAATDAGAKVVILEKMKKEFEGGNSKVSGNMWWTPGGAEVREQAIQYITALCYGLTPQDCIEALVDEQLKLNDWLQTLGIQASPLGIFQPEHPELPGSAAVRTWNNGMGGARLWTPLRGQVDKRKIEVLYEAPAKALIQLPSREIAGIRAEVDGKPCFIKAKKGVILCCGGFEFDFEMQKQFLPGWPIYCQGTPGNTGDGIRMAQQVGAQLWHMNNALAGLGGMIIPPVAPVPLPVSMPGGGGRGGAPGATPAGYICVDKYGKRFMSENQPSRHGFGQKEYLMFFDGINGALSRIPCYYIFDETTRTRGPIGPSGGGGMGMGWFANHPTYQWSRDNSAEIEKGWITKGESLADLASKLGMKELEATIARYNENVKKGSDPDFGRRNGLVPIETAPFYGVAIYPTMYNTQGGPKRNAKCQIVDPFDQPIPRLYSAGELGSFWGWMYNGGGNNAECLCTGRIAARNVVALKPLS
jgi:succinate dehydrogenase/fumarate reductase flavoprotein subunit